MGTSSRGKARGVMLISALECVRIEERVPRWHAVGRPPHDRGALANVFVAKAVLGLPTTAALSRRVGTE